MRDDGVDADENRVGGCCVAEEVLGDYEAAFYGYFEGFPEVREGTLDCVAFVG
jgi:hypothetical protein